MSKKLLSVLDEDEEQYTDLTGTPGVTFLASASSTSATAAPLAPPPESTCVITLPTDPHLEKFMRYCNDRVRRNTISEGQRYL